MTMSLERVRQAVIAEGQDKWVAYIPAAGMSKAQFAEMAQALNRTVFTPEELTYIVGAFSFTYRADDVISKEEFLEWCQSPMTVL